MISTRSVSNCMVVGGDFRRVDVQPEAQLRRGDGRRYRDPLVSVVVPNPILAMPVRAQASLAGSRGCQSNNPGPRLKRSGAIALWSEPAHKPGRLRDCCLLAAQRREWRPGAQSGDPRNGSLAPDGWQRRCGRTTGCSYCTCGPPEEGGARLLRDWPRVRGNLRPGGPREHRNEGCKCPGAFRQFQSRRFSGSCMPTRASGSIRSLGTPPAPWR